MTKLEKFILWVDDAGKVREMREAGGRIFVEKVKCNYSVVRVCLLMTMWGYRDTPSTTHVCLSSQDFGLILKIECVQGSGVQKSPDLPLYY